VIEQIFQLREQFGIGRAWRFGELVARIELFGEQAIGGLVIALVAGVIGSLRRPVAFERDGERLRQGRDRGGFRGEPGDGRCSKAGEHGPLRWCMWFLSHDANPSCALWLGRERLTGASPGRFVGGPEDQAANDPATRPECVV
jgi:hypothetical protein